MGALSGAKGVRGKLGVLNKGLGMATKGLLRFTPVIGQLYTGFTIADEALKTFTGVFKDLPIIGSLFSDLEDGEGIMDLFKSGAERAAAKLEKLGEASDKVNNAIETTKTLEENRARQNELMLSGGQRTLAQEQELVQLRIKEMKAMSQHEKSINDLDTSPNNK